MIALQPKPAGFFARYGKLYLFGAGIGTACASLLLCALLIFGRANAKATGLVLTGDAVYGRSIAAEVTVKNSGMLKAQYSAALTVDGVEYAVQKTKLRGGETKKLTMELEGLAAGAHTVAIDGLTADVRMLRPASFMVVDVEVRPEDPRPGDDVTVTATVRNAGEVPGDYRPVFTLDGKNVTADMVSIEPGGERTAEATVSGVARGPHEVTLGGMRKTFSALAPAHIEITGMDLSAGYMQPGGMATAFIYLRNSGDLTGSYDLKVLIGGEQAAVMTVSLGGGGETACTYEFSIDKEGDYVVAAGDFSRTLKVAAISRPATGTLLVKKANGGTCTLQISNEFSDRDVVVTLAATGDPLVPVLSVYVRAGEKTKTIKVKNGTYFVYYAEGIDYATNRKIFLGNALYRQFDGKMECTTYKTYEYYDYYYKVITHYSAFTLIFNGVDDVKASYGIGEKDFPR
jgi:hypothetical protein